MRKFLIILTLFLAIFTFSCKKKNSLTFNLNEKEVTMQVGDNYEFKYNLEGVDAPTFKYEIDANDIIEINANKIIALRAGEVNVKIKIDGTDLMDTLKIKVVEKPYLGATATTTTLNIGEKANISVTKVNIEGPVSYKSQSPKVASVTSDGVVEGLSTGTCIIEITCGELSTTISFSVSLEAPKEIKIESNSLKIVFNTNALIAYSIDGDDLIDKRVSFTSSDPNIATVDESGNVYGVSDGKCQITIQSLADANIKQVIDVDVVLPNPTAIVVLNEIKELEVRKTYQLEIGYQPEIALQGVTFKSGNTKYATVDENGLITAIAKGKITITIASIADPNVKYQMVLSILAPQPAEIVCETVSSMKVGEEFALNATILPEDADQKVTYSVSNPSVLKLEDNKLVAVGEGKCKVTVTATANNLKKEFDVDVSLPEPEEIVVDDEVKLELGATSKLPCSINPIHANQTVLLSSDKDSVVKVVDGKLQAVSKGEANVTVKSYNEKLTKTIKVIVEDGEDPEIMMKEGYKKDANVSQFATFDPLEGVTAHDEHSGNLDDKIIVKGSVDTAKKGSYELIYEVVDDSGRKATLTRTIKVIWNNVTSFIGHGGSYYGIMNSEEAIRNALVKLDYQAVEVDLAQTSDGVFVLSHDAKFGDYTIASTPWSTLKDVEITQSRNAGLPGQYNLIEKSSYTSKLCTLTTALNLCKEYGAKLVIELKSSNGISNSDQSRMPALMSEIESLGMLDQVIFLGSNYNCLIWVKQHGYEDIECQYLVNSIESETALQRCIDYDLTISTNVTYGGSNSDEWIKKYKDNGIMISTWTFTQYSTPEDVQVWIDKGVDYVTCDWVPMTMLKHYVKAEDPAEKHHVTFVDYDDTVLKEVDVVDGKPAKQPAAPSRGEGYTFTGWDQDISSIKTDLIVKATYKLTEYKIAYMENNNIIKPSKWDTKDDFVNEFYTDLFNYVKNNVDILSTVKFANGTYTVTGPTQTATFTDVESLKAVGVYEFEQTLGALFYKPLESRNADGSANIVIDEHYFLNSSAYHDKYLAMDQYFLSVMNTAYTSYSKLYKPASNNRVQITFRFHQWATKGTNIPAFDNYPQKYEITKLDIDITMPSVVTYTIEDEISLLPPTSNGNFGGWYANATCTGDPITKIAKGSTGDIVLYAKWIID